MKTPATHLIQFEHIVVRIRRKNTRSGIRHTVRISRLYRNGDTIKESTCFGRNDLPILRAALDEAFTWILENKSMRSRPS